MVGTPSDIPLWCTATHDEGRSCAEQALLNGQSLNINGSSKSDLGSLINGSGFGNGSPLIKFVSAMFTSAFASESQYPK